MEPQLYEPATVCEAFARTGTQTQHVTAEKKTKTSQFTSFSFAACLCFYRLNLANTNVCVALCVSGWSKGERLNPLTYLCVSLWHVAGESPDPVQTDSLIVSLSFECYKNLFLHQCLVSITSDLWQSSILWCFSHTHTHTHNWRCFQEKGPSLVDITDVPHRKLEGAEVCMCVCASVFQSSWCF